MTVQETLLARLAASQAEIIAIRRHLHEHPEVSFKEKTTAAYIRNFYLKLGLTPVPYGEGYGLAVDIDSGHSGPHIALCADFDALAVQEDNDLPFASQNPASCTLAVTMATPRIY